MSRLVEQFHLPLFPEELPPRYNIAPSQPIAAVRQAVGGIARELVMLRWGLVPAWAEDPAIGHRMINARAETAATKPSFRSAFRQRRCLVLADGFYEWQAAGKKKQPFHIRLPGGEPFAIAGLWERWQRDAQTLESCTLLTTQANEPMRAVHDRMPVILAAESYPRWLDPHRTAPEELADLLKPYEGPLELTPVSTLVNNPKNEQSGCIEPLAQGRLF